MAIAFSKPPLFQILHSFCTLLSPESETRIQTAVTILLNQKSKTRYNLIKTSLIGSPTFSPPESVQIILRIRNKPHLALRFFETPLCSRDLLTRSIIIHVTARARLKSHALSLIKSAILSLPEKEPDKNDNNKHQIYQKLAETYHMCDSAPFVFDLLVKGYLHFNKVDHAVGIVRILIDKKIEPLSETSTSLIRLVCKSKGGNAGLAMYRELFGSCDGSRSRVLPRPNVRTFNILLIAFYREGRMELAEVIKKEMERFECEASVFTYSITMARFCDEGLVDEAMNVWNEMVGKNVKPDSMAFNIMIKGYCERGELERAEELYREMGLSQIAPSCATFNNLIKGYCKIKDIDSALLLCKDMKRRRFRLESLVVDELIELLIENKRVNEGLNILREEMKNEMFEPNRKSYELLIKGFCKEGQMEKAIKLQAEMAGKGFKVSFEVYDNFVKGYRKKGDEEMANKLEKEMVETDL